MQGGGSRRQKSTFDQAVSAIDNGNNKLAEQLFKQVLEADPQNAHAMILLLLAQVRQRRFFRSMKLMHRALALAPTNPEIYRLAALVEFHRYRVKKGDALLEKAIALGPKRVGTYVLLGSRYLEQRKKKKAKAMLDEALRLSPNSAKVHALKQRYEALYATPQDVHATAHEQLRLDPESAVSHLAAGRAALALGDVSQAYWHFREALRLEPNSNDARLALLEALRQRFKLYNWLYRFRLKTQRYRPVSYGGIWLAIQIARLCGRAVHPPAWLTGIFLVVLVSLGVSLILLIIPMPFINLTLLLHPVGRYALTRMEKLETVLAGAMLTTGVVSLVLALALSSPGFYIATGTAAVLFILSAAVSAGMDVGVARGFLQIVFLLVWLVMEMIGFAVGFTDRPGVSHDDEDIPARLSPHSVGAAKSQSLRSRLSAH